MKSHEFLVGQDPWRITDWEGCKAKFGMTEQLAPHFVTFGRQFEPEAYWLVVRMRFAINPVIPDPDVREEFMVPLKFKDIEKELGCDTAQVKSMIEEVWEAWGPFQDTINIDEDDEVDASGETLVTPSRSEITPEMKDMLFTYGFSESIFDLRESAMRRTEDQRMAEVNWFMERISQMRVVFEHPTASAMARQVVLAEMQLRRLDDRLSEYDVESDRWDALSKKKKTLSDNIRAQWDQIQKFVPELGEHEKKVNLAGVLSDVIAGYQQWNANKDNTIIDGLHTAYELQVMTRQAAQFDGARHRPGFVAAVQEAKRGLWDPSFRRRIPDQACKLLDDSYASAMRQWQDAHPKQVVDLEKEGEGGEFPPIYQPKPDSEEEVELQPQDNVPIG